MKTLKNLGFVIVATSLTHFTTSAKASPLSFNDIWTEVQQDPYTALPSYSISRGSFTKDGENILERDAKRTLSNDSDLLPRFQKLVHPLGICFAGTWTIDQDSEYTGYFANGSRGLIIVRASEAIGQPLVGDYRSFGIAGKIFPTDNPDDPTPYQTANFFTVDDLGGTKAKSFFDLLKSNEPDASIRLSRLGLLSTLATIAKAFSRADSHAGIRQVYPIAELGLDDPSTAVTPHWLSLRAENTERNGAKDFRDELRLRNFADGIRLGIYVAKSGDKPAWQRLGSIHLTEEALTDSCDHRLHFMHPKTK